MPKFTQSVSRERFGLNDYIESLGSKLPTDWTNYTIYGDFGNKCLFCSNEHDSHKVWRINPLNLSKKETGTHCCYYCNSIIENMITTEYADELLDNPNSKDWSLRQYKIKKFNALRQFENDVHEYYLHLGDDDTYAKRNLCYFCSSRIQTVPKNKIDVPVSVGPNIDGGVIGVCDDCWFSLESNLLSPDENVRIQIVKQLCNSCKITYFVEQEEAAARKEIGSIGLHLCPKCTIESLENGPSFRVIEADLPPRSIPRSRYKEISCSSCKNMMIIDLTIDIKHYKIVKENEVLCNICMTLRTGSSNGNKLHVQYNDEIFIVIQKIGAYWVYHIAKIKEGKERILLKSPREFTKDPIECTLIAYEQCSKLLNSLPEQLKIWDQ